MYMSASKSLSLECKNLILTLEFLINRKINLKKVSKINSIKKATE